MIRAGHGIAALSECAQGHIQGAVFPRNIRYILSVPGEILFHLAVHIFNTDFIHAGLDISQSVCQNIFVLFLPVGQVIPGKAERAQLFPLCGLQLAAFSGCQIHPGNRVRLKRIASFHPGGNSLRLRSHKAFRLYPGLHNTVGSVLQTDPADLTVQKQVQLIAAVNIAQPGDVPAKSRKALRQREKYFLAYRPGLRLIPADHQTHAALVRTGRHVTINKESNIPILGHLLDFDLVAAVLLPVVRSI